MSTQRDIRLTPQELALKLAFAEAVHAAGGQAFVAAEVGRVQSRISDFCSTSTGDFAPVDIVRKVEALSAGAPGHPHVTRAMARACGVALGSGTLLDTAHGHEDLGDWLAAASGEFADVAQALAGEDLAAAVARLSPNSRSRLHRETQELVHVLQQLLAAIDTS